MLIQCQSQRRCCRGILTHRDSWHSSYKDRSTLQPRRRIFQVLRHFLISTILPAPVYNKCLLSEADANHVFYIVVGWIVFGRQHKVLQRVWVVMEFKIKQTSVDQHLSNNILIEITNENRINLRFCLMPWIPSSCQAWARCCSLSRHVCGCSIADGIGLDWNRPVHMFGPDLWPRSSPRLRTPLILINISRLLYLKIKISWNIQTKKIIFFIIKKLKTNFIVLASDILGFYLTDHLSQ